MNSAVHLQYSCTDNQKVLGLLFPPSGVYIMQNTMVGGGVVAGEKNEKLRVRGKKGKKKGGK